VACPEIPTSLERSQRDWFASFLFLLELVGIPLFKLEKLEELGKLGTQVPFGGQAK
jgi:hypothetical protein